MPDETTTTPAPVDTSIPQAPETPIATPPEAVITPAPAEVPVAPIPTPEPIPEPQTAHLGGNEPFEPATIESIPPIPTVETPVAVAEPAPVETITPEPATSETTQQTPTEPVIETVTETTIAEAPLVEQVETPAPTATPEPIDQTTNTTPTPAQVIATVITPVIAALNSSRLGASGEASATRIEASPQAPLAENINSQSFTKSIRELFTKAQLTIQNRKRKKLDRVLSLFAKQTMITNNEVEKLLHVSDATATRYLSTLEKEGKIKQNKKTGKGVTYSKI